MSCAAASRQSAEPRSQTLVYSVPPPNVLLRINGSSYGRLLGPSAPLGIFETVCPKFLRVPVSIREHRLRIHTARLSPTTFLLAPVLPLAHGNLVLLFFLHRHSATSENHNPYPSHHHHYKWGVPAHPGDLARPNLPRTILNPNTLTFPCSFSSHISPSHAPALPSDNEVRRSARTDETPR
ncbi:hypothetical protein E2C01_027843 [Portunus trituberculatus]|uniref:Uncharacterized protein n=1 Tax=Portunus trituberculatus TaxID=210409 RepID=A0A5B7EJ69_PORTR|nr:hypothetical protein [Portunus trituberculatus]